MSDAIVPDTKDWTWVLDRPCPDCGFDAAGVDLAALPVTLRDNAAAFVEALRRPDARLRRSPQVWSVLEYGCHVRDVHWLFDERVAAMLETDDPQFPNWDQDATAVEDGYADQQPEQVGQDLMRAVWQVASRYAGVSGDQWARPGRRSNGSTFTVDTLARYHLHDVVHHLHDVALMRHTEFWARMEQALGRAYARSWADQHVIADLGSRTVNEALSAGEPPKAVWRAVWTTLDLPERDR